MNSVETNRCRVVNTITCIVIVLCSCGLISHCVIMFMLFIAASVNWLSCVCNRLCVNDIGCCYVACSCCCTLSLDRIIIPGSNITVSLCIYTVQVNNWPWLRSDTLNDIHSLPLFTTKVCVLCTALIIKDRREKLHKMSEKESVELLAGHPPAGET